MHGSRLVAQQGQQVLQRQRHRSGGTVSRSKGRGRKHWRLRRNRPLHTPPGSQGREERLRCGESLQGQPRSGIHEPRNWAHRSRDRGRCGDQRGGHLGRPSHDVSDHGEARDDAPDGPGKVAQKPHLFLAFCHPTEPREHQVEIRSVARGRVGRRLRGPDQCLFRGARMGARANMRGMFPRGEIDASGPAPRPRGHHSEGAAPLLRELGDPRLPFDAVIVSGPTHRRGAHPRREGRIDDPAVTGLHDGVPPSAPRPSRDGLRPRILAGDPELRREPRRKIVAVAPSTLQHRRRQGQLFPGARRLRFPAHSLADRAPDGGEPFGSQNRLVCAGRRFQRRA